MESSSPPTREELYRSHSDVPRHAGCARVVLDLAQKRLGGFLLANGEKLGEVHR